ncbi:uncharacterized protein LOC114828498 [Galendromus occidentalis]|uniref:Uncharacterized protein LOC114828498 n=1 Tax=Galendromus occidentalis TaxID=34638 RepID=A0AAJ7SHE8_9ACAR|nr:uncharacterized protein LOC114828498 [Galendromus occidentalis]
MKTWNCVVLFVICVQILAVVEAQLLSRLLNRLLFSKRNSEEDDYPPYPRRRPPPYRRRRPPDHDPYKYDPDDDDYHRDHSIARPPKRPPPSYRKTKPHKEQDSEDTAPPMTIYLQPGANGERGKPKRIRIVTVNNYPPYQRDYGYGQGSPYHNAVWNRGLGQRDMVFPQNDYSAPIAMTSHPNGRYSEYAPPAGQEQVGSTGPRYDYDYYRSKRKRK